MKTARFSQWAVLIVESQSVRHDCMLFLLLQLTMASTTDQPSIGVSGPWTEYVRFLPSYVPVPTLWSENEKSLLVGTSLEVSCIVCAKGKSHAQK